MEVGHTQTDECLPRPNATRTRQTSEAGTRYILVTHMGVPDEVYVLESTTVLQCRYQQVVTHIMLVILFFL